MEIGSAPFQTTVSQFHSKKTDLIFWNFSIYKAILEYFQYRSEIIFILQLGSTKRFLDPIVIFS